MTDKQQIANRLAALIREKRLQNGYSYYRLSKMSGVHAVLLARIESGEEAPRLDTLIKICEALCLQIKLPDLVAV